MGVISIFIVLLLVYQNNNILGSIKLYEKLHNPSYVEYVHCDDILIEQFLKMKIMNRFLNI